MHIPIYKQEQTWCSILLVHIRTLVTQFGSHSYHWGNSHKWEFINKILNHFLKLVSVELVEHLTQWWVGITVNSSSYSSDTKSDHMYYQLLSLMQEHMVDVIQPLSNWTQTKNLSRSLCTICSESLTHPVRYIPEQKHIKQAILLSKDRCT